MSEKKINGELPKGCKLCEEGKKAVYFLTGLCNENCYYCPVSRERKNKDTSWINERKVKNKKDIVDEIKKMDAKGLSITGGEPLLKPKKTINKISFLKNKFGPAFHIHLYTSKSAKKQNLRKLGKEGLDEIRFHPTNLEPTPDLVDSIIEANKWINNVGIEIPAIPSKEKEIIDLIEEFGKYIEFLNLNEFEYSEESFTDIKNKGFTPKNENRKSLEKSEETAENIIKKDFDPTIHFCPSHFKDNIQLRKRFIRRANNIAKKYEEITDEGTILKGKISSNNLKKIITYLRQLNISNNLFSLKDGEVEIAWWILDELADNMNDEFEGIKMEVIEEHPTEERLVVQRIPL